MSNRLWKRESNGEIMDGTVNNILNEKHRPDNPLDRSFVPYLIMLFCMGVDLTIFLSLFKMISYSSPVLLAVQVGGFLLCFDFVPVFLGIMLRRSKAGLSSSKLMMYLALAVFIGAAVVNLVLRLQTLDLVAPAPTAIVDTGSLMVGEETAAAASIGSKEIAQTIFAVVVPLLTSAGSFFVSYVTFNPLKVMQKRYEKLLALKRDELRRVQAILSEYNADSNYEETLRSEERVKYTQTSLEQRSRLAKYMLYTRQKLIEALNDPASTSALSADDYQMLLEKVNSTLDAAKGGDVSIG